MVTLATYLQWAGTFVFVNDWAQQYLGATPGDLGTLAFYSGVSTLVATLMGGIWMAPRLGMRSTVVVGFVVSGLTLAVVPLLPDLVSLYWTQAIGGFARGLILPLLMAAVPLAVSGDRQAAAMGFFQATYCVGIVLGPIITGVIADLTGLSIGFWLIGILAMAGAVITMRLPARTSERIS